MKCNFPSTCWFAINVQNVGVYYNPIYSSEEVKASPTYVDTANKYWDKLYEGWNRRPDKPGFLDKTIPGLVVELLELGIDLQIEAVNDIRHGVYTDKDMYDTNVTERDRVETIGFKPIWSPGGFVI